MLSSKLLSLVCLLSIIGCGNKDSSQRALARIDDRTLTFEDVRSRLDSSRGLTSAQVAEYARRWINDEILYREGLRRGLDSRPSVRTQVDEVRRQLIINALLEDEVYTKASQQSTQEDISRYYNAHAREFALPAEVALVSSVLFRDRDGANAFRATVLKGTPWSQALRRALSDAQQAPMILARMDSIYYTQSTLLPVELWRVAAAATKPEPSFPIHTNEGFYLLIVWKLSHPGQTADLVYVEPEIRSRLAIERRRQALEALIENLRSKHAVEFLMGDEVDTSSSGPVR